MPILPVLPEILSKEHFDNIVFLEMSATEITNNPINNI
jgi:hypothetical protein